MLTVSVGALATRLTPDSYDTNIMLAVARNVVTDGSVRVRPEQDLFHLNSPFASYGLGMSLLMVPAVWLSRQTGRADTSLAMLCNAALLALVAVTLWLWARRMDAAPRTAALAAMLITLGTPLLPYVATGLSEIGVALGIALGLLGLEGLGAGREQDGLLVGLGGGVALLMRPDSLLLVVPLLAGATLALAPRPVPAAAAALVGATPAVLLVAGYNWLRFGALLQTSYATAPLAKAFGHPVWRGLRGLLISPGKGVLWYAPLTLLIPLLWPVCWGRARTRAVVCAGLLLVRLVFYAPWYAWYGGWCWGPRYLVPAMPTLLPFVLAAISVARRSWSARVGLAALVVASIGVQGVGTAVRFNTIPLYDQIHEQVDHRFAPEYSNFFDVMLAPETGRLYDELLNDWRYWPIAAHAHKVLVGEDLAGRYIAPTPHPVWLAAWATGAALGVMLILSA
jgi:hypothetical protein